MRLLEQPCQSFDHCAGRGISAFLLALLVALLASGCASTSLAAPLQSGTPGPVDPGSLPTSAEVTDFPGAAQDGANPPAPILPIHPTPTQEEPAAQAGRPAPGAHRVIVTLKVPFKPEGDLTQEAVQAQRAAIAKTEDDLLASLAGHDVTLVMRLEAVPQLVLFVDDAALSALKDSPLVADVQQDEPVPPDSLPESHNDSDGRSVDLTPSSFPPGGEGSLPPHSEGPK